MVKEVSQFISVPSELHADRLNELQLSNDWEDHLAVKHFSVEGQLEFRALLFVPRRAPFDLFRGRRAQTLPMQNNMKVYGGRLLHFIMDDCEELPEYLNFVTGVLICRELPLNMSREALHQNKILPLIKNKLVFKCLEMVSEIAEKPDDYKTFCEQFVPWIKLGIQLDHTFRELMRRHTLKFGEEQVSFEEYVDRVQHGQNDICMTREKMCKKGLTDEYAARQLREFVGKKPKSTTKEGVDEEDEKKKLEEL